MLGVRPQARPASPASLEGVPRGLPRVRGLLPQPRRAEVQGLPRPPLCDVLHRKVGREFVSRRTRARATTIEGLIARFGLKRFQNDGGFLSPKFIGIFINLFFEIISIEYLGYGILHWVCLVLEPFFCSLPQKSFFGPELPKRASLRWKKK